LIEDLAILNYAAAQTAFQRVSGLLQYPARGGVSGVRLGVNSPQPELFKGISGEPGYGLRHPSFAPIWFCQPVAHFGRQAMNVPTRNDSYGSDGFFLSRYSKERGRILAVHYFQERSGAVFQIRMRKRIAQVEPYFPVVRVFHHGGDVAAAPWTDPPKRCRYEHAGPDSTGPFFGISYIAGGFTIMSVPLVLWIVIAAALAVVFVYRKVIEGGSDELVHVSDVSDAILSKQEATARTLQQLDKLVMVLAIVFVVYGLALGCLQIYQAFNAQ
jgi:hypothetical protein